jgi:hypothetical protein
MFRTTIFLLPFGLLRCKLFIPPQSTTQSHFLIHPSVTLASTPLLSICAPPNSLLHPPKRHVTLYLTRQFVLASCNLNPRDPFSIHLSQQSTSRSTPCVCHLDGWALHGLALPQSFCIRPFERTGMVVGSAGQDHRGKHTCPTRSKS